MIHIERYTNPREILMPEKRLRISLSFAKKKKKKSTIHLNELSYSKLMMIPKLDNHHIKGHFKSILY